MKLFKRFLHGDPLRKAVNKSDLDKVYNILENIKGVNCEVKKDPLGLNWTIEVNGKSDTELPEDVYPPWGSNFAPDMQSIGVNSEDELELKGFAQGTETNLDLDPTVEVQDGANGSSFVIRYPATDDEEAKVVYVPLYALLSLPDYYLGDTGAYNKQSLEFFGSTYFGHYGPHYMQLKGWPNGWTTEITDQNNQVTSLVARIDGELEYVSYLHLLDRLRTAVIAALPSVIRPPSPGVTTETSTSTTIIINNNGTEETLTMKQLADYVGSQLASDGFFDTICDYCAVRGAE